MIIKTRYAYIVAVIITKGTTYIIIVFVYSINNPRPNIIINTIIHALNLRVFLFFLNFNTIFAFGYYIRY
ncbi:hypothetical protein lbkm_0390 [Lachnospiraceae bacterium KM106-2]|nr:hypothetical protein lbkm_0390 [Lachnospiraceae bacterium KM106-2]